MSLHFKSLASSSSGNCLALWSDSTRILIDCGLASMRRTRLALANLDAPALPVPSEVEGSKSRPAGRACPERSRRVEGLDAVLVSHAHADHISYYPLRVLEDLRVPLRIHENSVSLLKAKHFNAIGLTTLKLKPFTDSPFTIGNLSISPFEVPHNPYFPTYGFVIRHKRTKVVIATDFHSWQTSLDHFLDADFLFVESNHDLELLRLYYNPNSEFHLPNPQTARLLCRVVTCSRKPPATVMLGHLSSQRNHPDIALAETRNAFKQAAIPIPFRLLAAPRLTPSDTIRIS